MSFIARFFLLVLLLSFGELYLLFLVASELSILATLLLCVLTGVLGGAMVRQQGYQTLREIKNATARGRVPATDIVSGLILLMIGTMLLTPGFITDTIAFLLLIPALRKTAAAMAIAYFERRVRFKAASHMRSSSSSRPPGQGVRPEDVVIEVDAREE